MRKGKKTVEGDKTETDKMRDEKGDGGGERVREEEEGKVGREERQKIAEIKTSVGNEEKGELEED